MIQKPYYGQHQINTSLYAKIGEFILPDGTDYEGMYHELPNGQTFTGATQGLYSKELVKKNISISNDVRVYNRVKNLKIVTHNTPVQVFPKILDEDYNNGYIERFFVQKRNNPYKTLMEINFDQYVNIGSDPGNINELIWNKVFIHWKISKLKPEIISSLNRTEVEKNEINFPGLKKILSNYLEFSK